LNAVDLLLLVVLSICTVRGYVRGIFREIMGLAGFTLGAVAALSFHRPAASFLQRFVDFGSVVEQVVAAILIFIVVNLLTHLAAVGFDRLARAVFLGGVSRMVGALVGLAKGAAVFGFLLFFFRVYVPVPEVAEVINHSRIGAPLAEGAAIVFRAAVGVVESPPPKEA
jgi:uncharacterized membrane protein required for colicin V production